MRWLPAGEPEWVMVGLHGMNDYSNAFHLAATGGPGRGSRPTPSTSGALAARPSAASGRRPTWSSRTSAPGRAVRERHPNAKVALAGVSMGGAWPSAPWPGPARRRRRLMLFAPAVWGWSNQPLPNRPACGSPPTPPALGGQAAGVAGQERHAHRQHRRAAPHGPRSADDLGRAVRHHLRPGRADGAGLEVDGRDRGPDRLVLRRQRPHHPKEPTVEAVAG
jgi:hypothetical protein